MIPLQCPPLDAGWSRRVLTVLALMVIGSFVAFGSNLKHVHTGALVALNAFALALCAYYFWLLFRRLQCSLVELCLVIGMLGNVEGILLTTPSLMGSPGMWALLPLSAAWIVAGAVKSSAQCALLGITAPLRRAGMLLLNWMLLASPALLLAGGVLYFGQHMAEAFISRGMAEWGFWMIPLGALGCIVGVMMEIRVTRAARALLGASAS
ncbi:MAG TPA: hypothetical protein VEJ63_24110 [Planctomycetota bacterium]|nr:hypothetical protein [Planctomycetota bacterium]